MADVRKPLTVTWDDVRASPLAPKSTRRRLLYTGIGLALASVFTWVHMHGRRVEIPMPTPIPVAQKTLPKPRVKTPNLCDQLRTWTGSSKVSLSSRTEAVCDGQRTF